MDVAILAFPEAVSTSVTGPYDILVKANQMYRSFFPFHQGDRFNVHIVGFPDTCLSHHPLLPIEMLVNTSKKFDLVIIPASEPQLVDQVLERSDPMLEFIKAQHAHGAELASICMGAFILAQTGLIDGKRVTTHWMGAERFRTMFPEVILDDDKIILDSDGIYSCGGAFTFTTFIMYLVEKYCGRETALALSKVLLIDLYKDPQSSYNIFNLQKTHEDSAVIDVQKFIEDQYRDSVSVENLAQRACMSRRTLLRRFKSATGNTPMEYLQRVRIEAAKKLLETSDNNIENLPSMVGYEDYGFFLKTFKKFVGVSPKDYRKKYTQPNIPVMV